MVVEAFREAFPEAVEEEAAVVPGRSLVPNTKFRFMEPPTMVDGELELLLDARKEGNNRKGLLPAYHFNMINSATGKEMGHIRLRIGSESEVKYFGNIGYDVNEEFRGNKYAARSIKLILPFAFKHGLENVWISCSPDNLASRRSCEIAGGVMTGIFDIPKEDEMYKEGERQKCWYRFG